MKNEILEGLTKVAHESKSFDPTMSDDLDKLSQHLSTLTEDDLDSIASEVESKVASLEKEAKLINEGDIVICVDNYSPLFKGRRYLVSNASIPGYLCVKELDPNGGGDVGIFAINRFVLDNNEQ
jgi:hypothetical protein